MHILIGLAAIVGAIVFWVIRARMAADATRELVGAADDVRAAVRRFGFRKSAGRHPADLVEDPRLAAAGMLVAIAKMDGDLTQAQKQKVALECRASFRVDQKEAEEIAAYGRWLADQSSDPEDALRRLAARVLVLAPEEARRDLIGMLERVAEVEGGVSSDQRSVIAHIRSRVLPA